MLDFSFCQFQSWRLNVNFVKFDPRCQKRLKQQVFLSLVYEMLEDMPKVFTHANKAFASELKERLREDTAYQTKPSLSGFLKVCEGLIVEWQKAHCSNIAKPWKIHEVSIRCETSLTKNLRGMTNLDWNSPGKSWKDSPYLLVFSRASCTLVDSHEVCQHA